MVEVSFLKRVLTALDRMTAGSARVRLDARLRGDSLRLFRGPLASATTAARQVMLDDAEDLLLAIDSALGDGSGRLLQQVGQALANQYLIDESVPRADVMSSMRRLLAEIAAPFSPQTVELSINDSPGGLELVVWAPGRPRTARVMRHLCSGYLRAAFTLSLEATSSELRLIAETTADRSSIVAKYRNAETSVHAVTPVPSSSSQALSVPPPSSRPRPRTSIHPGPTSETVDRILRSTRSGSWPAVKPPRSGTT